MKRERLYKLPWGAFAGVLAMIISFVTIAVAALYIVADALAIEGAETATLFDTWYQTGLFIFDMLCVAGFIVCLIFAIMKRKNVKSDTEMIYAYFEEQEAKGANE